MNIEKLKEKLEMSLHEEVKIQENKTHTSRATQLIIEVNDQKGRLVVGNDDAKAYLLNFSSDELKENVEKHAHVLIEEEEIKLLDGLELPISNMNIPQRAYACLNGYMDSPVRDTLGKLMEVTKNELISQQLQLGSRSADLIEETIQGLGYSFKKD